MVVNLQERNGGKPKTFGGREILTSFKEYSIQDSVALLNALNKAQIIYFEQYQVDITTILSTATLSLKIFRQHFQDKDISILNKSVDIDIRKSYFGGSTDYYRMYGENLYYYDVNSLYSKAMCNPMPNKLIKEMDLNYIILNDIKLNNIFGFIKARITCPKDIKYPLLPFKKDGFTIHPTGTWIGTYFSEELKEIIKHG